MSARARRGSAPAGQQAPDTELAATLADIASKKPGAVCRGSGLALPTYFSSGVFVLDYLTLGGFQESRSTMIYGNTGCGKSTLAALGVAEFQRKFPDREAVWLDAEHLLDPGWHANLGVDMDRLLVAEPQTGEEGVDIVDAFMRTEEVGLIVVDSVPSMVPFNVVDKSAEDLTVGEAARLMGRLCSKITAARASEARRGHHFSVVFINQWRSKIGVMFGDPRTLPGGRQLEYHVLSKIDLKKKEVMVEKGEMAGGVSHNEHEFRLTKYKGAWAQQGAFNMAVDRRWKGGVGVGEIDNATAILSYARREGLTTGGGNKNKFDPRFGVGETFPNLDAMRLHLHHNPELARAMAQVLIMAKREECGVGALPPDGYLYGDHLELS